MTDATITPAFPRPVYEVDPWCVRERELHLDRLAQSESVFALANGHIGLRGNLEEGEPHGIPGSYLNSFFELRPLPYAEAGYGYPESGQTVINVTNGKIIRLLVDDEPFDVRYGRLNRHERELDMRASPYDLTAYGYAPVAIETPEGKAEYAAAQRGFAARGAVLRGRLLDVCHALVPEPI